MNDYEAIVEAIGEEAAQRLCNKYGGGTMYIPKAPAKEKRNKAIREKFDTLLSEGSTCMNAYNQTARAYQVTVRTIQNICNK
jgi:DNA invertase Pin-like site-specific DNA recombinase